MVRHLSFQRGVHAFSSTFSPFVCTTLLLFFTISIPIFYAVIKQGCTDYAELSVFLGIGVQILIR